MYDRAARSLENYLRKLREANGTPGTTPAPGTGTGKGPLGRQSYLSRPSERGLHTFGDPGVLTGSPNLPGSAGISDLANYGLAVDSLSAKIRDAYKQFDGSAKSADAVIDALYKQFATATGANIEILADWIRMWEELRGNMNHFTDDIRDIGDAAFGIFRLADAMGVASEELRTMVDGLGEALYGLEELDRVQKSMNGRGIGSMKDFMTMLPGMLSVASGVVGIFNSVGSILRENAGKDEARERERLQREWEMMQEQKEAMDRLTEAMYKTAEKFQQLLSEDVIGTGYRLGDLQRLMGTRNFTQMRFDTGNLGGRWEGNVWKDDQDAMAHGFIRQAMGMGLADNSAFELWESIKTTQHSVNERFGDLLDALGLSGGLDELVDRFGEFNDTIGGILADVEYRTGHEGLSSDQALNLFLERLDDFAGAFGSITLGGQGGFRESLAQLLKGRLSGIDLSTEAGRSAFAEIVKEIAGNLRTDPTLMSNMRPEERAALLSFLEQLANGPLGGAGSVDEDFSKNVQYMRTITEVQGSEMLALEESQLFELQAIRRMMENGASLGGMSALGEGSNGLPNLNFNISAGLGGDVDTAIRSIMQQIENEIRKAYAGNRRVG